MLQGGHIWGHQGRAAFPLWKNSNSDYSVTTVLPPHLRYPGQGYLGVSPGQHSGADYVWLVRDC